MAKTYNNFGVNRATVTPTVTLATGAVTPFGSSPTNLAASTTLLGNTVGRSLILRRKDKNFYHRMRDYVANTLYPTNSDRLVNELRGSSVRGFWRQKKVDINLTNNKTAIGVAPSATIDPNSEAWKQWVGKQHIGFPMNDLYDYYAGQSARLTTYQDNQYMHDNIPQYIATLTENENNYTAYASSINAAVVQGTSRHTVNRPDFTPFCMVTSSELSGDHSLNTMNTLHPLADSLSGCTVGQKYSVSDLLGIFRDLFFNEVLDFVNHPTQVKDFTALRDLVYSQLSPTNKQPYINIATIPNMTNASMLTMLYSLGHLNTMGSPVTGGATGLVHFEGTYHSGVAGFETIERLMSAGTITAAYTDGVLTSADYNGTAAFSKQGRVGALRALLMVVPDNIKRKQYELGLTTTKPTELYSGLMSVRPLGKFTTLSTADGWACEVRLKETQLSLIAFGVGRFATGSSSIGTVVAPNPTNLHLIGGLHATSYRPMASYTKLNYVDFTQSGQNCRIYGFADILSTINTQYSTNALCASLEGMGNIDPSIGDKILPNSTLATIGDTYQVRLCVVVPFELSGMVKDGSGNVPYFTLAEGSSIVLNNWTSKAAFAYIQGSYHVYTRIMNFAQMKAIHGATKTFEECMDLATTAFINECRNYFDVAETDPNPVEQLMAYTPLNSVGYNLPAIRSYVKPQYDYRPYPQNAALDGAPNLALIKKSSRIGGMYFGGTGVRIDGLQKFVYGTRGSSSAVHSTTVSTSVDMYIQWLWGGAFLPPLMDGAIGYYYGGEREQVKTKWGGGRLFRLNNSDQTLDTFKYSGRMGFRAASLNNNVLSYSGAYKFTRTPYGTNTPTLTALMPSVLIRPSYNAERAYSAQAEVSPELVNSYLQTIAVGKSFQRTAADYGAYAFTQSTTYAEAFPDKGTVYDFTSDATRTVKGIARKDDIPTQFLPVRLYDRATGELLAHQLSQAGGLYKFYGLQKNRRYSLVVLDPQRDFNSVIEDVEVILT